MDFCHVQSCGKCETLSKQRLSSQQKVNFSASDPHAVAAELLATCSRKELVKILTQIFEAHPGLLEKVRKWAGAEKSTLREEEVWRPPQDPEIQIKKPAETPLGSQLCDVVAVCAPQNLFKEEEKKQEFEDSFRREVRFASFNKSGTASLIKLPTILQFASSVCYVGEEEGEVVLEVQRIGTSSTHCSVSYKTVNKTAIAGVKFQAASGRLDFKPDELVKEVRIRILDDSNWDATLEFGLELTEPENARLSTVLCYCRVKILDNDAFPTNRYQKNFQDGRFNEVPRSSLLFQYALLNWRSPAIRSSTLGYVLFDLLDNVLQVWFLALKFYLVDQILVTDGQDIATGTWQLVAVGTLTFIPHVLLFVQERARVDMRVAGQCRNTLQKNMLRKFLNYEESVRATIKESDVMAAVLYDCPTLVAKGYVVLIELFKECSLLLLMMFFQLWAVFRDDEVNVYMSIAFMPSLVFPICMVFFVRQRVQVTARVQLRRDVARNELGRSVQMIVENFHLIMAFSRKELLIERVEGVIKKYNDAAVRADRVSTTNKYFAPTFMAFLICCFVFVGGRFVLREDISVAEFLTTLDVLYQVCASWNTVYTQLLDIEGAYPALDHVVRYLNLPIDLPRRKKVSEVNRHANQKFRIEARQAMKKRLESGTLSDTPLQYAIDTVPLQMTDVTFAYTQWQDGLSVHGDLEKLATKKKSVVRGTSSTTFTKQLAAAANKTLKKQALVLGDGDGPPDSTPTSPTVSNSVELSRGFVIAKWNMTIPQGTLNAMVGRQGEGKGTLLKIMGGVLIPWSGSFFAPPQLRVFYVTQQPLFFGASLLDNLTFGVNPRDGEDSRQRAKSICVALGVQNYVIDFLNMEIIKDWITVLSQSQRSLLHLARALVANPEVLVIEKPSMAFGRKTAAKIMALLRQHVDEKGLFVAGEEVMRRPRTVIYTAGHVEACGLADNVFQVERSNVWPIAKEQLTSDLVT